MEICSAIDDCRLLDLPKVIDPRGNLTFVNGSNEIPFDIKRVFYIYDVPAGESRGAHAHKEQSQFLICLSGGFDVKLDDGFKSKSVHLNDPSVGLYIPPMIWASETNFITGSVCLVLASDIYAESDYLRSYKNFINMVVK